MKVVNCLTVGLLSLAVGCGDATVDADPAASAPPADSEFVTQTEPADALPVGQARESVADGDAVTVVGTIGGSTEPFVEGLAAFTIVDPKVPYCAPEEGCPTPWDYCCTQDQVKDNIATIKIVDDQGSAVTADARQLLGVQELSTVVVKGTASRDDNGNLTVAATEVFVRPVK